MHAQNSCFENTCILIFNWIWRSKYSRNNYPELIKNCGLAQDGRMFYVSITTLPSLWYIYNLHPHMGWQVQQLREQCLLSHHWQLFWTYHFRILGNWRWDTHRTLTLPQLLEKMHRNATKMQWFRQLYASLWIIWKQCRIILPQSWSQKILYFWATDKDFWGWNLHHWDVC